MTNTPKPRLSTGPAAAPSTPLRSTADAQALIDAPPARLLLLGPVGSPMVAIARRIAAAMPRPSLDAMWLHAGAGLWDPDRGALPRAPLRAPHHTVSTAALCGARSPGEVSLAHDGLLLLDDVPEFRRHALAALGSALRNGRAADLLPAVPRCVVATARLCPCGWRPPGRQGRCYCGDGSMLRFAERVTAAAAELGIDHRFTLDDDLVLPPLPTT